jgi:hypothetical protein
MNIKQKITHLTVGLSIMLSIGVMVPPLTANAAQCGGVQTSIVSCTQQANPKTAKDSGIWGILLIALNILTAGVGIIAVGGIVYAAVLYTSASDRAAQVQQAKDIIQNVAFGLAAYGGMYLLLNFLIPGGIFT